MVLPANSNRILYKFRPHELNSEKEFLNIKSTDRDTYQKKIKLRIKKEQLIYFRHHWLSLITYLLSTLIAFILLIYIIISGDFKNFSSTDKGFVGYILLFIFAISIITSVVYYRRGFPSSLMSFLKYKREKYKYYNKLKSRIDNCKDYYSFKGV